LAKPALLKKSNKIINVVQKGEITGMTFKQSNHHNAGTRATKEPWFWSLMALLTFLLSHNSTYADWPLPVFAVLMSGCLLRLIFLSRSLPLKH